MKPWSAKPQLKPKWLLCHPIELWTRGDWSNLDERDAYYTTISGNSVRVCLNRDKTVTVEENGVELARHKKWHRIWQHLHLNAHLMQKEACHEVE